MLKARYASQLSGTSGRIIVNRFLVFLIAGWSGFYVMAVEMLGGRLLAPTFGGGIYVWGAVITVFMLALSLGYLIGGRMSVHAPSFARLSCLLWAAAITGLPVVLAGDAMLDRVFELITDPRYGSLVGSLALFFAPTLVSGMVSPYAVRLLVEDQSSSGWTAGLLYFASTLGSAAGTILTSFYLVLYFDVDTIFWALLAVSAMLGAIGVAKGRAA